MIPNTNEWIEFRKSKIGASDAPVIMGVSPWKTPMRLWEEKMGLRESQVSPSMIRGLQLEEEARLAFEDLTGITVFPKVMIHPEHDWMIASLDGIDIEHQRIVEIKCPGKIDHECAMDGQVPEKYYPQLQHQMIVCGLDLAFYFSYTDESCKILEVERSREYERILIDNELNFLRCMQDLEPPAFTSEDYVAMEDEQWVQTAKEYLEVKSQIHSLKEKEESLRKNLIRFSGGLNAKGGGIQISRQLRKGPIDYAKIPELKVIDLNSFRKKPIETWRIDEC